MHSLFLWLTLRCRLHQGVLRTLQGTVGLPCTDTACADVTHRYGAPQCALCT